MKKDKLTPRKEQRKGNKSVSPCNATSKAKLKNCYLAHKIQINKENDQGNQKEETSMKICLDLANYHKKEA